jgi:hypothetical protein
MSPPQEIEQPEVSPDGRFFMFASEGVKVGPPGSEHELPGFGHNEIYRYSSADGSVVCVSCGPGANPATSNAFTGGGFGGEGRAGQLWTTDSMPEAWLMSSDGSRVFFESEAALTPEVVNAGMLNVYEWEADATGSCAEAAGCIYLISRGNSASNSLLLGASEDGSNVFFFTRAQLVPQDRDSSYDIYDARENGGFPAPSESVACLGDTCQNVPPPVIDPPLATSSPSGTGNLPPAAVVLLPKPKRCASGRVRAKKGSCAPHHRAKKTRRAARHVGGSR